MIRIYPNRASCERFLVALLLEFDEHMSSMKVHLDMAAYRALREAKASQAAVTLSDKGHAVLLMAG